MQTTPKSDCQTLIQPVPYQPLVHWLLLALAGIRTLDAVRWTYKCWRQMMLKESRPPFPPFTRDTAIEKVRLAEDGWNSRDAQRVSLAYSVDSRWRNRAEFSNGRPDIVALLTRKWRRELDYRLIKELWAFTDNRIAVRFAYESHDDSQNWYRSYGNENWEFNEQGLMIYRYACINDLPIAETERLFRWPLGRRPDEHPGLSDLGL